MRSRPQRGQEGSALLIALVFVTVFSLIVAGLLGFSEVGLRAAAGAQRSIGLSYAADGAVEAAIHRYATTGPCDDYTAPWVKPPTGEVVPVNGQSLIVRCQGPPPAGSRATQPSNALLSLGTGPGDGITSSGELRLLGDVYSTTTVSATGTMIVQGEVSAVGACTGAIETAPPTPLRCANGPDPAARADPSTGRDPGYTPAATAVPVRRTVPACPTGWLVTLDPGYYDDAAGLTALTGSPACNDKVVWFQPGVYYFDFTFLGVGPTTWSVNNPSVVVVGGTPRGWDPKAAERPQLTVPGTCEPASPDGVQLIAGGGTRLQVTKGAVELCASTSDADQRIALFGLRPPPATRVLEATNIDPVGFTSARNAQTVGETPVATATAALAPATPAASLALSAFRPGVPAGSVIDAVSLVVKHREDGDIGAVNVTADFPGSNGACGPATPRSLTASPGAIRESRIDLQVACGLNSPEGFADLAVTYAATLAAAGTAAAVQIDGVVVEVAYRTPVTRKPTAISGPTVFATPRAALEIGEQPGPSTADALLSAASPSASLTVAGLGDPPLPVSATIDAAVLRVAHQDQGDAPTVTVPFPAGTCSNLALPVRPDRITEDRVDLKACGLNSPAKLKGLTATFSATLNPSGAAATSRLDGMWLEVVSSGPSGPLPPAARQAANATSTVFANPDRARVIGESPPLTADADLSGATNTAGVTVSDFNRTPVAPGSAISAAKLRVAHQEDANVASVAVVATVAAVPGYPGGTCPPLPLPSSVGALATSDVDLAPCGLRSPDQLAGLAATYTVIRRAVAAAQVPATAAAIEFLSAQERGRSIDGTTADAKLTGTKPTASVTLTGYGQPPPPAGSTLEAVTLRVAHRHDGDPAAVTAAVSFDGNTCTTPMPLPDHTGPAVAEDVIDLRPCGLADPAKLAGLSVSYQAALTAPDSTKTGDDHLDGVEVAFTYRPPAVDKLDGIELDVLYQAPALRPLCPAGPQGCGDLITVDPAAGDTTTRFSAQGTIYAPTGGVDITMDGLTSQVLTRGLVARSIKLGLSAPDYKRPTGAIPPETVVFTAYPDVTQAPKNVTGTGFANPRQATLVNERPTALTADAALDAATSTAQLDLTGYDQVGLPNSAKIDGAVLRVVHQDLGNTVAVTVKVGATTCVDHQTLAPKPVLSEDQIALPSSCGLAKGATLGGLHVTYDVALPVTDPPPATAAAKLDGITLDVLSGPLLRATVTFDRQRATVQGWNVLR